MVGSRLGQVRLGYVTFLCDRYGSTCDANHTNTQCSQDTVKITQNIMNYFVGSLHERCSPTFPYSTREVRSRKSEEKEWKNTHKIIKRSGKFLAIECQFPPKFPNSRTLP